MIPEAHSNDGNKSLASADWRTQFRQRITTVEQLREWIEVTETEEQAIRAGEGRYRWAITPYYASLMDKHDETCPIRRQAVPSLLELERFPKASVDPVDDRKYRVTNRVIHKYPDRVVILASDMCAMLCRHCTRKFHTIDLDGTYLEKSETEAWDEDFDYIANTPAVRDVLLTGGDPLVFSDDKLERIISRLRQIPHVEIIRIGSRFPVVLPQRITPELCSMLEKYHPLWLNTQFNHPREITPESARACDRLTRHGIVVQNQSVLLKGINDDLDTMRALLTGLVQIRVRPYYLYHCDNAIGVSHFVTSLEEGRRLMKNLTGYITGFAVPQYIITTTLGKIPLWEEYVHPDSKGGYWCENYRGETMNLGDIMIFGD